MKKGGKLTEKALEGIERAEKEIGDAKNFKELEAGLEKLQKEAEELGLDFKAASATVDAGAEQMENGLYEVGISAEKLDDLEATLKKLGLWSADLAQKFN
jgi:hypothetical protein